MNNQRLNTLSSLVLAFCALIITGLVVRREFFINGPNTGSAIRNIPARQWRPLLRYGHHLGSPSAPIKLVEFSDFQCPFCEEMEPRLQHILKKYSGKVEFIYYNFPLPMHPQALPAARAAECAGEQGDFFVYHDILYKNQASFDQQPWDSLAQLARIKDIASFNECLKDTLINGLVKKDKKLGQKINVQATPTFVINGKMIAGAIPEDRLDQLVQQALKK